MEASHCRADDPAGLIIPTVAGKIGKRMIVLGAFHEHGIVVVHHYPRRALSVPPTHKQAAASLFLDEGDLEHGRRAA
jgi:hypothetical protein